MPVQSLTALTSTAIGGCGSISSGTRATDSRSVVGLLYSAAAAVMGCDASKRVDIPDKSQLNLLVLIHDGGQHNVTPSLAFNVSVLLCLSSAAPPSPLSG